MHLNTNAAAVGSSSRLVVPRKREFAIKLTDLPDDLIIRIYRALGLKDPLTLKSLRSCEDAFRLSLTCKRAFGIFKSSVNVIDTCYVTPSRLSADPPFRVHRLPHISSALRMFTPLREVHLSAHVVDALNEADASVLSSIEYIHIEKGYCDYTMVAIWPHVFRMTPKLKKVWLQNPNETTVAALVNSRVKLESLGLYGMKTGSIQLLAQFFENGGGANMVGLAVSAKTTYAMTVAERRRAASWMLSFISFVSARKSTLLPKVRSLSMGMSSPYVCAIRPDMTSRQDPNMEATTTMDVNVVMKVIDAVRCRHMGKKQPRHGEANQSRCIDEKNTNANLPGKTVLTHLRLNMEPDLIMNAIQEAELLMKPDTALLIDIGTAAWVFQRRGVCVPGHYMTVRMHIPLLTLPAQRFQTCFPWRGMMLRPGHKLALHELVLHKRGVFELFEFDEKYRQWLTTFIRSTYCKSLVISAPLKRWKEADIYVHTKMMWTGEKVNTVDQEQLKSRLNNVYESAAPAVDWKVSFKMLGWLLKELNLTKSLTISMEIMELCSLDLQAVTFVEWLRGMKELTHLAFCMPTAVPHADPLQNGIMTVSPAFVKGLQKVANLIASDKRIAEKLKVISVDCLDNNIDFDSRLDVVQRIENVLAGAIEAINNLARERPSMDVEAMISLLDRWRLWEIQLDEDEWLEDLGGICNRGVAKVSNAMCAMTQLIRAMAQSD